MVVVVFVEAVVDVELEWLEAEVTSLAVWFLEIVFGSFSFDFKCLLFFLDNVVDNNNDLELVCAEEAFSSSTLEAGKVLPRGANSTKYAEQ